MNAGRKDRKIKILRDSGNTTDSLNARVENFSELRQAWAQLLPVAEIETQMSEKQTAVRTVRFRIWFDSDVKATDRLEYDGLQWDIVGLRELGRREELDITAVSRE